jgi:hypothetical protein
VPFFAPYDFPAFSFDGQRVSSKADSSIQVQEINGTSIDLPTLEDINHTI